MRSIILKQAPSPFLVVKPYIMSKFQKVKILISQGSQTATLGHGWHGEGGEHHLKVQICKFVQICLKHFCCVSSFYVLELHINYILAVPLG